MPTAARKTPIEPDEDAAPVHTGLDARDVQLDRLRVVGKLAKLIELEVASAGDIAIGQDAEDEDSTIPYKAKTGKDPIRFAVLSIRTNYGCKFGGPQGQWDEGDPDMPPEAKRQYNYMLCIPAHSTVLPVLYTASSTAAREGRKINTKIQTAAIGGTEPYTLYFEMTTKVNTSGTNSWPGPAFKLVEPTVQELSCSEAMYNAIVSPARTAIGAGEDDTPDY